MGNLDTQPVRDMNEFRELMAVFTEKFYDMKYEEAKSYINVHARNGFVYIEYSYKQIGMGQEYYRDVCKVLNWDKMKIKREVLLQRVRGTTNSPFDPEDLDRINAQRAQGNVEEHIICGDYLLRVYKKLDPDTTYLMGVDVATGKNEDSTSITITDPYTLTAVANLKSPLSDEVTTSELIAEVHKKFVPKAVVCIEANHTGSSIISILRRTPLVKYMYNNPDKMFVPSEVDKLDKKQKLIYEAENRKYWGIYTQGDNRELMMKDLLLLVSKSPEKFICNELIDELNTLIRKSSGKIEADTGFHDDVVMSYLMTVFVYNYGVKLKRWGIIKGMTREMDDIIHNKEATYEDIYNTLPDEWKAVFPDPNAGNQRMISPEYSGTLDEQTAAARADEYDEYQRRLRELESSRMRVTIDKNSNIVVDNETIKEMIEAADRNKTSTWTHDQFDIADLLNQ